MSFKEYYIKETYLTTAKDLSSNFIYHVYKNPNEHEINQIFNEFIKDNNLTPKGLSNALRGMLDIKINDIYVWNANLLHGKAKRLFNLPNSDYNLIFNPKKQIIELECYSIHTLFNINLLDSNLINKLKNTGYKYFVWEIDDDTDKTVRYKYNLATSEIEPYTTNDYWESINYEL